MTWGQVHVGDTVRGADQRVWVVCERRPGSAWVAAGEHAEYVLRLGDRTVTCQRKLIDPAPVVAAADHRMMAAATGAVYATFPDVRFIEETTETMTQPAEAPAAACTHPAEKLTTLKRSGRVKCTACKEYVPGALPVETPAPDGVTGGGAMITGSSAPANPTYDLGEGWATGDTFRGQTAMVSVTPSPPDAPVANDPFSAPAPAKRGDAPTGKWGWYKLPHPITGEPDQLYPRVSTIAKTLADEYGLTEWKLRMVAKGVAIRPDLAASAAAADPDTDKKVLGDIVKSAMEAAEAGRGANFGTAMHKFAERLDDGESAASMHIPDALKPDLTAYAAALKAAGLTVVPEYSERVVVNAEHGYAGRIDRIVRDRQGVLRILDLKTGKEIIEYGGLEVGTAQASYANCTHMASRDFATYEPMPAVDLAKSFILHLPIGAGSGQVYALDIGKGWRAAIAAFHVRAMRTDARSGWLWAYSPGTPADAVRLRIGRSATVEELGTGVAEARRMGAWDAELESYALSRYDVIRAHTATSADVLAALWAELQPAGRWTGEVDAAAYARKAELDQLVTAS
jgi:hypothetical protein